MPSLADFQRCVATGAGGTFLPLASVADALDDLMAATAERTRTTNRYVLPSRPIPSTLRVRAAGSDIPRSSVDGFDYDPRANTLVFRGALRPENGAELVVGYHA